MRRALLVVALLELALVVLANVVFWIRGAKSDLAGQGMAQSYVVIATILALLLLVPALLLAYHHKAPWVVAVLCVVAAICVVTVVGSAVG